MALSKRQRAIVDAYQKGQTTALICKTYKLNNSALYRLLHKAGVKMRSGAPPVVDTINQALQTEAAAPASPSTLFSITGPVLELIMQAQQERRISHVAIQETSPASVEVRFLINRGKV